MDTPDRTLRESERGGAFVVLDPAWRQKIFFGGLLILLCHPVGWPVALGYRKVLISHLALGTKPILPDWNGNVFRYYFEGLKAMGVIFGYLAPLYLAFFGLLFANGVHPNVYWLYAILFFAIATMFSTLSFPSIVMYWTVFSDGYRVSPWFSFLFIISYALVVFFIPAGFLQVSKTGRYLSAFRISDAARTLMRNPRRYIIAWYRSVIMSLCGHFALPFAPWGVFWCYLGIIYEFNSILSYGSGTMETHHPDRAQSWYSQLEGHDYLTIRFVEHSFFYQCFDVDGQFVCTMLKFGPTMIPLPSIVDKLRRMWKRPWNTH